MATGYFSRRRIMPGYLACKLCDRDLPEEDFRLLKRVYAGKVKYYRTSYCRSCESAYNTEIDKANAKTDREYREKRKRMGRVYSRRNRGAKLRADRHWRLDLAQKAIARLNASGWSCYRIQQVTGIKDDSLRKWQRGDGAPRDHHVRTLRALAAQLEMTDR